MYNEARKRANEKYLSKLAEIKVRLTPEEKKAVERKAKENGTSVNQYIKDRILG